MSTLYKNMVLRYGPRFQKDLGLSIPQVSGLFGNLAVETGKFTVMQEKNPIVAGSRGGYGWAQWTGPRRRAYEAWCAKQCCSPSDPEMNYQYIVYEMRTVEKNAYERLRRALTASTAAGIVCDYYERPGIPHRDKRIAYALEAERYLKVRNEANVSVVVATASAPVVTAATIGWEWAVVVGVLALVGFVGYKLWRRKQDEKPVE